MHVDEDLSSQTTPPGNGAWIIKNSWGSQADTLTDDLVHVMGPASR